MEEDRPQPDISDNLDRQMPSGHQSRINGALSGAGNYGLIGGVPWVLADFGERYMHVKVPTGARWVMGGLAAIGAVYGAGLGLHEAKQLDSYRNAINEHIEGLTKEIRADRAKIDELRQRLDEKEKAQGRS